MLGQRGGLGLALAEQLAQSGSHVVLTARDQQRGATAAAALADRGLSVESAPLDVQCGASIAAFGLLWRLMMKLLARKRPVVGEPVSSKCTAKMSVSLVKSASSYPVHTTTDSPFQFPAT